MILLLPTRLGAQNEQITKTLTSGTLTSAILSRNKFEYKRPAEWYTRGVVEIVRQRDSHHIRGVRREGHSIFVAFVEQGGGDISIFLAYGGGG